MSGSLLERVVLLARVSDLRTARESRAAATSLASWLAKTTGATILSVRPGHVLASLSEDEAVEVLVKQVNPYRGEAEAYRRDGKAVPRRVLEDIERWDREHGR